MSVKSLVFQRMYGGYADDPLLGIANSFDYAKRVETRKNPNSLTLAFKVVNDSSTTIDSLCKTSVTIQSTGDFVVFGTNGKIWIKQYGHTSYVEVYTQTAGAAILNAIEYNGYLYWFTATKVNRIQISTIIYSAWGALVTEGYKTFTVGNTHAHPAQELFNKLYIGDGYYLAELDSLGTFTGNKIEIYHDEEIRCITYSNNYMRLYSRRTAFIDDSACYMWSGTSTTWEQKKPWKGKLIHCAFEKNGVDYVIAGRHPKLYKSDGYTYVPLKRIRNVFDNEELFLSPNSMCVYDDLVCFGVREAYTATKNATIESGVFTWGQESNTYPESYNFEYPTHNNDTIITAGSFVTGQRYFIKTTGNTDYAAIGSTLVNATAIVVGQTYIIKSVGTTNFTYFGAETNTVDTVFTASQAGVVGAGTGTVYIQEFTASGVGSGTGTANYDNTTDAIGFVNVSNGDLYFSWGNMANSKFGIEKVDTTKYADNGYVDTLIFYGAKAAGHKEIKNIEMSFVPLQPGEAVQIFWKHDFEPWRSSAELTASFETIMAGDGTTHKQMDTASETIGDTNELQARLMLTAGTSNATTPELIQTWIDYDDAIELGNEN